MRVKKTVVHGAPQDAKQGRVLYLFRRGREGKDRRVASGEEPDDMFYGWNHLKDHGLGGGFLCAGDEHGPVARWLWYPIERVIARVIRMGFRLDWALRVLPELRQAAAIVSTTDSLGLPLAALKRLGLLTTPHLYFSQGLAHRMAAAPFLARALFRPAYGTALRSVEKILVLGEGAKFPLVDMFRLDPERVSCVQFGVDIEFWSPAVSLAETEQFVLTVGSDLARDYPTLSAALTREDELVVVSRLDFPKAESGWTRQVSGVSNIELRELYRRAAFVVTPLRDVDQPSGQSATLQAMACGKAVVLTNTRGLWDRDGMRDGENCLLVPPGDVAGLRVAMRRLSDDVDLATTLGAAARETVIERYDSRQLGAWVAQSLQTMMGMREP